MANLVGGNLRRLMAGHGLTVDQVAANTGLDRRTLQGILGGGHRPHSRTIQRLAAGLGVSVDEFFVDSPQLLYRQFDHQTNPLVNEVLEAQSKLFADWTPDDFAELHSRVGTGGPMTGEGVLAAVRTMNLNRATHEKLSVLLESSQADVIRGIVELMYEKTIVGEQH
jgi:transcriptional regulator with XRE-family HTH domain